MAQITGAKEVLMMAMDMEQTGQAFYEALGLACNDARVARLCVRLAKAEQAHFAMFRGMFDRVFQPGVDVPLTDEQLEEAHRLVTSRIQPDGEKVRQVAVNGRLREGLDLAMQMERDSIEFYRDMLRFVPDSDRKTIDKIIEEEKAHLKSLTNFQT